MPLWSWVFPQRNQFERMIKAMSDLSTAVDGLKTEVSNLKGRVTAHEALLAETVTKLQAVVAGLSSPSPDVAQAVTDLKAMTDDIKSFDPEAAPAAPVAPAPTV